MYITLFFLPYFATSFLQYSCNAVANLHQVDNQIVERQMSLQPTFPISLKCCSGEELLKCSFDF